MERMGVEDIESKDIGGMEVEKCHKRGGWRSKGADSEVLYNPQEKLYPLS